jgi:hypothetical protein
MADKPENPPSLRLFKSFGYYPFNFGRLLQERTKPDAK